MEFLLVKIILPGEGGSVTVTVGELGQAEKERHSREINIHADDGALLKRKYDREIC